MRFSNVRGKLCLVELLDAEGAGVEAGGGEVAVAPVDLNVADHILQLVQVVLPEVTESALQPEAVVDGGVDGLVELPVLPELGPHRPEVGEEHLGAELAADAHEVGREHQTFHQLQFSEPGREVPRMVLLDVLHCRELVDPRKQISAQPALEPILVRFVQGATAGRR